MSEGWCSHEPPSTSLVENACHSFMMKSLTVRPGLVAPRVDVEGVVDDEGGGVGRVDRAVADDRVLGGGGGRRRRERARRAARRRRRARRHRRWRAATVRGMRISFDRVGCRAVLSWSCGARVRARAIAAGVRVGGGVVVTATADVCASAEVLAGELAGLARRCRPHRPPAPRARSCASSSIGPAILGPRPMPAPCSSSSTPRSARPRERIGRLHDDPSSSRSPTTDHSGAVPSTSTSTAHRLRHVARGIRRPGIAPRAPRRRRAAPGRCTRPTRRRRAAPRSPALRHGCPGPSPRPSPCRCAIRSPAWPARSRASRPAPRCRGPRRAAPRRPATP